MYDFVLKGGTVVDPSSGLDGVLDVAVENGVIARIAPGIAPAEAARVIEVGGKIVTPGLIDLHAHVSRASTERASIPISAASTPA